MASPDDEAVRKRTERLFADPARPEAAEHDVLRAAAILREGGTVAFATETVYGLGAHALDAAAVAGIFAAKARPAWDPLIVHIAELGQLDQLARYVPATAKKLMRFWPGPLTLLLPRTAQVPDAVTAGRDKVGVRIPSHPVAHRLLLAAGIPVAAPSANRFGHVSPTTAAHVLADLDGRIDAVLDSGPTAHGVESTVVEPTERGCVLYRPGALSLEVLRTAVAHVEVYMPPAGARPAALPSPGVGIRHYAPRARLLLVEGEPGELAERLRGAVREAAAAGGRIGLMLPEELGLSHQEARAAGAQQVLTWGRWSESEILAGALYGVLRELDDRGVGTIVCPVPEERGLGAAVVDRLRKAARPR